MQLLRAVGLGLASVLVAGNVHAAEPAACPERVTPEAFHERVQALREPVAFAEPDALDRIRAVEALLPRCVDGPVSARDLAALWLARGAWEVLSGAGGSGRLIEERLTWAYALAASLAWDPIYGPEVGEMFEQVGSRFLERGTLTVAFPDPQPVEVWLNGERLERLGQQVLPEGMHLVQWKAPDGAWDGEFVRIRGGEDVALGGGDVSAVLAEAAEEQPIRYRTERKRIFEPTFHFEGAAGYAGGYARVVDGAGAYDGLLAFPYAALAGRMQAFGVPVVRLEGRVGPGADLGRPGLVTAVLPMAGVLLGVGTTFELVAGPWIGPLSRVEQGDGTQPAFAASWEVGVHGRAEFGSPWFRLRLEGDYVASTWSVEVGGSYAMAREGFIPELGLRYRRLSMPSVFAGRDVVNWAGVEGGVRWAP